MGKAKKYPSIKNPKQTVELDSGLGRKYVNHGIDDEALIRAINIGCKFAPRELWQDKEVYLKKCLRSLGDPNNEYLSEAWMVLNQYINKWDPSKCDLSCYVGNKLRARMQEIRRKEAIVVIPQSLNRGADKIVAQGYSFKWYTGLRRRGILEYENILELIKENEQYEDTYESQLEEEEIISQLLEDNAWKKK